MVVYVHRLEGILELPGNFVQALVRHRAYEVYENREPQVVDVTGDHDGHRQVEDHQTHA